MSRTATTPPEPDLGHTRDRLDEIVNDTKAAAGRYRRQAAALRRDAHRLAAAARSWSPASHAQAEAAEGLHLTASLLEGLARDAMAASQRARSARPRPPARPAFPEPLAATTAGPGLRPLPASAGDRAPKQPKETPCVRNTSS